MYRTLSLSKIENTANHFTSSSWACLRCSKYLAFRFPLVTRIISLVASTSNCIGKCTAKCKAFSAAVFQVRRDEFAGFSDYAGNFISLMSWSPIATLMVDMNHVRMWCNVNHYRVRLKGGSQVAWMLQAKPGRSDKQQQEQNSTNLGTKWITAHWSEVFATHHLKTEEGAACLTVLAARLPSRKEEKVEVQPSKAGPSNQVSCSLFCLHFQGGNRVTRSVHFGQLHFHKQFCIWMIDTPI